MARRKDYYGILPVNVLHDAISDGAKVLYAQIRILANTTGYCWASNRHLGANLGKGKCTISKYVAELLAAGHIRIETDYKEEKSRRRIYPVLTDAEKQDGNTSVNTTEDAYEKAKENAFSQFKNPTAEEAAASLKQLGMLPQQTK